MFSLSSRTPAVMVGLGTTIHEFLAAPVYCTHKLVDGRTKSDHDEVSDGSIALGRTV